MPYKSRIPEGPGVDEASLEVFAKVAGWGARPAAMRVHRILKGVFQKGAKVLDMGTGPGTIPLQLKCQYPETQFIGLDISPEMLQKAAMSVERTARSVVFLGGDGEKLPFRDQTFDLIYMVTVLAEIPEPSRALQEAKRVLRDDGHLAVTEYLPDPDYPLRSTTIRWGKAAGFEEATKPRSSSLRDFWSYTVRFTKPVRA